MHIIYLQKTFALPAIQSKWHFLEKAEKSQLDIFSDYAECVFFTFPACFQVLYSSIQRTPLLGILIVNSPLI